MHPQSEGKMRDVSTVIAKWQQQQQQLLKLEEGDTRVGRRRWGGIEQG
jgi:hypothetical protein